MRTIALAGLALMLGGCMRTTTSTIRFSPPPRAPAPPPKADGPRLLSAHFAVDDAPMLGPADGIALVFSHEVDAASLTPDAFMVVLADGSRVFPREAILAPASEGDENRTVLLVGDFGDPRLRVPEDVLVIRSLHAETGESLEGLNASITPFEAGGHLVVAEQRSEACDGGAQRIRTYWSDGLRGVEPGDLEAVTVELVDGKSEHPVAFEDHRLSSEDNEDNVLDLCVGAATRVVAVRVAAGAFADPPGHLSVATQTTVARAPTSE